MNKKVAFFGAGSIYEKTVKSLGFDPIILFDNNKDLHGTKYMGIDVISPNKINEYIGEIEVIYITTTSFTDVYRQLLSQGILEDLIKISPVLKSIMFVEKLENFSGSFLFTSGLPSFTNDLSGGGLYELKINKKSTSIRKIHSGNCHGLVFDENDGVYYLADNDLGVLVLDKQYEVQRVLKTQEGLRPHGVSVLSDDYLAVGCSYDDSVYIISKTNGQVKSRLGLSNQIKRNKSPQHHLNDVWCDKGVIYASMFSITGNWKRGVFDGGVIMFNDSLSSSNTGNHSVIIRDLQMPHNFQIHSDNYIFCNSLNGQVISSNGEVVYQSNGFVRGLCNTSENLIIGESRNRNFANISGSLLNACIDTRISIVDKESGAYRSVQIPGDVSEVHSIVQVSL